jgi:hypothetical protein
MQAEKIPAASSTTAQIVIEKYFIKPLNLKRPAMKRGLRVAGGREKLTCRSGS